MCGSTNMYWDARGLFATNYRCRKCGYAGALVLESGNNKVQKSR